MAYLNNCPICGKKIRLALSRADRDAFYCECPECGKSTDEFLIEEEAVAAWNNSSPEDLKDTDDRILLSVVMRPVKTWFSTFERIFMLLLGPVALGFLLLSFNFNPPIMLWLLFSIVLVLWLSAGIILYVKYAMRRSRLMERIPKQDRPRNLFAIYMGFFAALLAHVLLFITVLWPLAAICQQTGFN